MKEAQRLLEEAVAAERDALEAVVAGRPAAARFAAARRAYAASYRAAPPASWGRLIGALKCALLAGDADAAREIARAALGEAAAGETAPAAYLRTLARVTLAEAPAAADVEALEAEGGAFARTGRALAALAEGDGGAYAAALAAVVADFESRERSLVAAVADTAMVLERLAEARGMAVRPASTLVPAPA